MPRVCSEEQLCVSCEFVTKFAVYGFFAEHRRRKPVFCELFSRCNRVDRYVSDEQIVEIVLTLASPNRPGVPRRLSRSGRLRTCRQ